MASVSQHLRELVGPLLPPKDQVEEEEDDCGMEEETEDSVFVDAEELCSGGLKAGGLPSCSQGEVEPRPAGWGWRVWKKCFLTALSRMPWCC